MGQACVTKEYCINVVLRPRKKVKDFLTRVSFPQTVGWTATNNAKIWLCLSARSEPRTQQLPQRTAPLWGQLLTFAHWEPKICSTVSRRWNFPLVKWNGKDKVSREERLPLSFPFLIDITSTDTTVEDMPVYYAAYILRVIHHLWATQFCHLKCKFSWKKSGREQHKGVGLQCEAWKGACTFLNLPTFPLLKCTTLLTFITLWSPGTFPAILRTPFLLLFYLLFFLLLKR